MTENIEITDRYSALGIVPPCPWTGCRGGCEGMGVHPMRFADWLSSGPNRPDVVPQQDESGEWESFPPSDGWLFVRCATCGGSARRVDGLMGLLLDAVYVLYYPPKFALWAAREDVEFGGRTATWPYPARLAWWLRFIWREEAPRRRLILTKLKGR